MHGKYWGRTKQTTYYKQQNSSLIRDHSDVVMQIGRHAVSLSQPLASAVRHNPQVFKTPQQPPHPFPFHDASQRPLPEETRSHVLPVG